MVNTMPGYWDVDRCSWVGFDPVEFAPPVRHAEHTHERDHAGLPGPRAAEQEAEAAPGEPGEQTVS